MTLLCDENIPRIIVQSLGLLGYKVEQVFGLTDKKIIENALLKDQIILTLDKDFLEMSKYSNPFPKLFLLRLKNFNRNDFALIVRFIHDNQLIAQTEGILILEFDGGKISYRRG
jgi:predicted nuclease of predicted toxin-antitoxin system